ncbi:MAG: hypothetical protein HC796_08505 [Synechococcaceae cyanobacterium RL_1_2]|nr:hypothetical protein [Synechococcaceae cyanobacterium RL_1_2]
MNTNGQIISDSDGNNDTFYNFTAGGDIVLDDLITKNGEGGLNLALNAGNNVVLNSNIITNATNAADFNFTSQTGNIFVAGQVRSTGGSTATQMNFNAGAEFQTGGTGGTTLIESSGTGDINVTAGTNVRLNNITGDQTTIRNSLGNINLTAQSGSIFTNLDVTIEGQNADSDITLTGNDFFFNTTTLSGLGNLTLQQPNGNQNFTISERISTIANQADSFSQITMGRNDGFGGSNINIDMDVASPLLILGGDGGINIGNFNVNGVGSIELNTTGLIDIANDGNNTDVDLGNSDTTIPVNVILNAGQGIRLNQNSTIQTNGGNVDATATSANYATNYYGVVSNGGVIDAGGGNITIAGTGGSPLSIGSSKGIVMGNQAKLSTIGLGNITMVGISPNTIFDNGNIGIELTTSGISTVDGTIDLQGFGGGVAETDNNYGIYSFESTINSNTGAINLRGFGGSQAGTAGSNNQGIRLEAISQVVSNGGAIAIVGTGGNAGGSNNDGVSFQRGIGNAGPIIQNSLAGAIAITGTAGDGNGNDNDGVSAAEVTISIANGDLTIIGEGKGAGDDNQGIDLNDINRTTLTSTGNGSITLIGTGANSIGTRNDGVILGNSDITGQGAGFITILGKAFEQSSSIRTDNGTIINANGAGSIAIESIEDLVNNPVSLLEINDTTFNLNSPTSTGNLILMGDEIELTESSPSLTTINPRSGANQNVTLKPLSFSTDITIGGTFSDSALNLNQSELSLIQDGFANILINHQDDIANNNFVTGTITLNALNALNATTLGNTSVILLGGSTLQGDNFDSNWTINSSDSGNVILDNNSIFAGTINFQAIENLIGGTNRDTFTFTNGGTLAGSINGGNGIDTLTADNLATNFVITGLDQGTVSRVINGFTSIEALQGGSADDTFTFTNVGSLSTGIDGQGGNDTLIGDDDGNVFTIGGDVAFLGTNISVNNANAGNLAGKLSNLATGSGSFIVGFNNIENLTGGSGIDQFTLFERSLTNAAVIGTGTIPSNTAGTITGRIDGGAGTNDTLSLGEGIILGGDFVINAVNGGTATGLPAGFTNIENLVGNNASNIFTFDGGSFSGAIDGGAGNDQFNIDSPFTIIGQIDGGPGTDTLSYLTSPDPVTFDVASLSTDNVSLVGIETLIGSSSNGDTIVGTLGRIPLPLATSM